MKGVPVTERPILFNGDMVRAILEGRKTVTRREVKPQPDFLGSMTDPTTPFKTLGAGLHGQIVCPYGQPGDRLWVRETWSDVNLSGAPGIAYRADDDIRDLMTDPSFRDEDGAFNYDDERVKPYHFSVWSEDLIAGAEGRWRPSIHMPRWASRILLEVTAVRVERLHDGEGETDFESRYLAEGLHRIHHGDGDYYYHALKNKPGPGNWCDPFDAWRELWCSVYGVESWNANPWVWVVEFKRIEQ